mmetsp:Transcript_12130/g.15826  ORF Transcript_12130/g.15826 Transcript_12130/m.15826 type:complete len:225 (-) Transcript_12130:94-768(-)|eukprot:CAMPEP_0116069372 /NCGR_PEP_ID=MMETSP0322-20121206/12259_1 /TAXON_ID=163516 /ORGANISM="Leptocylindrus danicus var. apora, Strain B651" /LENGTH=224 /DNA_ID=CAMNT_0003556745 /DNA_START=151 /DNA_END=825 /DNA_ORIENTATION=-
METVIVTKNDVLCGRSPSERAHIGNLRLQNCIELHGSKYLIANKSEKSRIIRTIVESIQKTGGRFLKKKPGTGEYAVISPRSAKEKVGLAMREAMLNRDQKTNVKNTSGAAAAPVAGTSVTALKPVISSDSVVTQSTAVVSSLSLSSVETSAVPLSQMASSSSPVSQPASPKVNHLAPPPKTMPFDSVADYSSYNYDPLGEELTNFLTSLGDDSLTDAFFGLVE